MTNQNETANVKGVALTAELGAAIELIRNTAFDLIEKDPHLWSTRPCSTCAAVSTLLHRPYGCEKKRLSA